VIIAELCQNHNGDMELLQEMVAKAAQSGAHFAKIQTFFAEDLQDGWGDQFERMKQNELNFDQHEQFVKWCRKFKIIPMTSVYTTRYAQQLYNCGFEHVKIGSAQCTDTSLILSYITAGFKVTISTGGHSEKEIPKLAPLFGVLHCVSQYPTDEDKADLIRMVKLRKWFPTANVGLSDHSQGLKVSKLALTMGAQLVERHFSLLPREMTKDGVVSINAEELTDLCRFERLPTTEKLKEEPSFGMIVYPKEESEIELIKKYKTRFR